METAIMNEARARDAWCRFPCSDLDKRCRQFSHTHEVAHAVHRGMGGDPKMTRTTRQSLLLLCPKRHQHHRFSVDQKTLKWEALTDEGTDGPIRWWVDVERLPLALREEWMMMPLDGWLLLASESAPHIYLPFTEEQQDILAAIQ